MRTVIVSLLIVLIVGISFAAQASPGYKSEYNYSTRRGQLYDNTTWDAKIIYHATFFSDKFRREFTRKHAQIKHLGPLADAQWTADQQFLQDQHWDFVVIMYTKKEYKNFSMDPGTFWEAFLTKDDGQVIYPDSIEQLPVTPYEKIMYPRVNRWSRIFRISFPKVDLGTKIYLTMQSIVGNSTVEWAIKK